MVINTVDRERGEGDRLPPRATSTISLAILTLRTLTINITEETGRVTREKLKVNNFSAPPDVPGHPLDCFLPPLVVPISRVSKEKRRLEIGKPK
ncbi:hypothetical protein K0M31_008370 [Melipona bicolor]|uniref:Uncharacterized protein n=1 Tax=Melipona bicolor TaxID=60889 RepID=A0AA40FQU7_9HYME|nr:hypothetical protein K0M31_008370 [Melipona bicolor]